MKYESYDDELFYNNTKELFLGTSPDRYLNNPLPHQRQ